MKKIIILLSFMVFACQSNDDEPINQIDLLPPITQTGENTFGCLFDGNAFLPDNLPSAFNCYYQFVGGEYFFNVRASNFVNENSISLAIKTEKKQIFEGQTYDLFELSDGNAYGFLVIDGNYNYTSHTETGQLTITKLDLQNNIVAGTFWYDIKDQNDVIHEVRDGRFDMQFTQ